MKLCIIYVVLLILDFIEWYLFISVYGIRTVPTHPTSLVEAFLFKLFFDKYASTFQQLIIT